LTLIDISHPSLKRKQHTDYSVLFNSHFFIPIFSVLTSVQRQSSNISRRPTSQQGLQDDRFVPRKYNSVILIRTERRFSFEWETHCTDLQHVLKSKFLTCKGFPSQQIYIVHGTICRNIEMASRCFRASHPIRHNVLLVVQYNTDETDTARLRICRIFQHNF
jgi:hypothetical protein